MKKFIIGLVLGIILTASTAAYASDTIQAYLFPAKYVINGEEKSIGEEYASFNYNGHTYVPIRYIAENLGAAVVYDDASKTITVDDRFDITDMHSSVRASGLKVIKKGDLTEISGQLFIGQQHWDRMVNSRHWNNEQKEVMVTASLMFYDENAKLLKEVRVEQKFATQGDQIKPFNVLVEGEIPSYALVVLSNVSPVPLGLPVPPQLDFTDSENRLAIGVLQTLNDDEFTRVHGWASLKVDGDYQVSADFAFYDENGDLLGTVPFQMELTGKNPSEGLSASKFDVVGRGNFASGYKTVKISNVKLQALK